MLDYSELVERIQRILDDAGGQQYPIELIYDGVVAAHHEVLPWVPALRIVDLEPIGTDTIYELPEDTYQVECVFDTNTSIFLSEARFFPGQFRSESDLDWLVYPNGFINLSRTPTATLKLHLQCYWEVPFNAYDETFWMAPPQSTMMGIAYFAAAHCLSPKYLTSATIRQFNTKVDSGNPTDNPLMEASLFLRQLFLQEMERQPKRSGV